MLGINPKDYRSTAAKAVRSIVNAKFAGFFSEVEIEDLVSDVVTRMWSARETFDPSKGKEFTWIWTIARNVVNDAAVAKHNRENIGGRWNDEATDAAKGMAADDSADSALLRDEFVENLYDRLHQERDRRLLLYLSEDMEYEEIARREGLTLRATYMAIFHLRQRLNNAA
jgi:RNA polymerase sigma-70 factor (ECF subfamily)